MTARPVPRIHLLVDGRRVGPEHQEEYRLLFRLQAPFADIRLQTGAGRPCDLGGQPGDTRLLGLCVWRIRWRQGETEVTVPLASPSFIDGFYHLEVPPDGTAPFRWTNGDAALPADLFPPWDGPVLLDLDVVPWAGTAVAAPSSSDRIMLQGFDSLGDSCELAIVQRHYGVELPLSLLRWSGTSYEKLLAGLENRFDGLGDPGSTTVSWVTTDYRLETPYLNMHTTNIEQRDAAGVAEVLRSGCATLRLLRRRMLVDIAAAKRIYVFKTPDPGIGPAEMHRLHAALRAIGPASLLCVTLRQDRPAGSVERLAEGLYAGSLDRFVSPDGPFDIWLELLSRTQGLAFEDLRQRVRA